MTSLKSFIVILLSLAWTVSGAAQSAPRSAEELDALFAPIALYPDALVALMLPAATDPADISRAAGFLSANGDMSQLESQPWDESVKSLAHYPDVLRWMDANPAWTQQAGDAFLAQPVDVMNSVQRLRSRAIAAGALVDTPQQDVVNTGTEIRIIPAQPDVIYVPYYSPDIFYSNRRSPGWRMSFGPPLHVGAWLNFDLDWDRSGIWAGGWYPGWDFRHPAWRGTTRLGTTWTPPVGHPWRPSPTQRTSRPIVQNRAPQQFVRPAPTQALQPPSRPQPRQPLPAPRPAVSPQSPRQHFTRGPTITTPAAAQPAIHAAPPGQRPDTPPANRGTQSQAQPTTLPAPAAGSFHLPYPPRRLNSQ